MVIEEMAAEECAQVLMATRLARLACAFENQPYVVPVYLAYHDAADKDPCFYGFTTRGQKVEWMTSNPLVCVEVDEIKSYDEWVSVVVLGRYEELAEPCESREARLPARANLAPDATGNDYAAEGDSEMQLAHDVLQAKGLWWEPGISAWKARTAGGASDAFRMTYYKIRIDQITGHRARREGRDSGTS